jgi:HK97 family phage portal protein
LDAEPPGAPEAKTAVNPTVVALANLGLPSWSGVGYAELARQAFASNPIAYRCIRMIAEAAASAPLVVFADGRRAPDHPMQRLLDRSNSEQSGVDLLEGFFGALQTGGDAYLQAVGEGAPSELYTLRPDRLTIVPGPRGWPLAYDYRTDTAAIRIGRRRDGWMPVLHLKLFNPTDDHYGLSPLRAARFAVDIHNASSAWNKALLDNAARPCGALTYANAATGDRMTAEQFDRLKAELSDAHTGAAAAGLPLLLEGGLDWKPMSLSPAEMDFIEGKHVAAREIALAFGVPPQLLGIPGDATYNTYREAQLAFWRNTIAPLAERAARALSGWLGPLFGDAVVAVDLDGVPALAAEREALWARLEAASFLTLDERRRMAGLGQIEPDAAGEISHD